MMAVFRHILMGHLCAVVNASGATLKPTVTALLSSPSKWTVSWICKTDGLWVASLVRAVTCQVERQGWSFNVMNSLTW
eukprot:scaffold316051_cov12-Tisochrysis_lutea.AAC.1